jgi:hypothetical protein
MSEFHSTEEELTPALRRHLAAIRDCDGSGESMKRYADQKGLSIHTLYQAKKVLRKKGVLRLPSRVPAKGVRAPRHAKPSLRFVQAVRREEEHERGMAWRVRLPGGGIFESDTALTLDEMLQLFNNLSSGGQA